MCLIGSLIRSATSMPSKTYQSAPIPIYVRETVTQRICSFGDCRGGTNTTSAGAGSVIPYKISRSWTRTPNWKVVSKSPNLPQNPFTFQKEVLEPGGVVTKRDHSYWSDSVGNSTLYERNVVQPIASLCSPVGFNDLVSVDELSSKLINKLKTADWQAPVFVAEARKTAQMVFKTAADLASIIRDFRRGDLSSAFKTMGLKNDVRFRQRYTKAYKDDPSKAAANAWLQTQYGWIPLLSDAKSAAETLASFVADPRHTVLTAKAASKRSQTSEYVFPYSGQPVGNGSVTLRVTESDSRRFTVRYKIREPFRELGQLGLLNPAAVAWELVPFSFVADWFLPIGDYLSSLDVGIRYEFVNGLSSRLQTSAGFSLPLPNQTGPSLSWSKTLIQAQPMGGIPTPTLSGITFRPELNLKRMISGISLLRQQAVFFDRLSEKDFDSLRPRGRGRRVFTEWRDGQP